MNPGNLLFPSSPSTARPGEAAGEVYTTTRGLLDAWVSLGPEAFLEAAVLLPEAVTTMGALTLPNPFPGAVDQGSLGLRLSGAPWGILTEGAWAIDGPGEVWRASASTQFNLGADWYGTLRLTVPFDETPAVEDLDGVVGAFLMLKPAGDFAVASRNEVWIGSEVLNSYHDLALTLPEDASVALRGLVDWEAGTGTVMADLRWAYLQGLGLYLRGAAQVDENGLRDIPGALGLSVGVSTKW